MGPDETIISAFTFVANTDAAMSKRQRTFENSAAYRPGQGGQGVSRRGKARQRRGIPTAVVEQW